MSSGMDYLVWPTGWDSGNGAKVYKLHRRLGASKRHYATPAAAISKEHQFVTDNLSVRPAGDLVAGNAATLIVYTTGGRWLATCR